MIKAMLPKVAEHAPYDATFKRFCDYVSEMTVAERSLTHQLGR